MKKHIKSLQKLKLEIKEFLNNQEVKDKEKLKEE